MLWKPDLLSSDPRIHGKQKADSTRLFSDPCIHTCMHLRVHTLANGGFTLVSIIKVGEPGREGGQGPVLPYLRDCRSSGFIQPSVAGRKRP